MKPGSAVTMLSSNSVGAICAVCVRVCVCEREGGRMVRLRSRGGVCLCVREKDQPCYDLLSTFPRPSVNPATTLRPNVAAGRRFRVGEQGRANRLRAGVRLSPPPFLLSLSFRLRASLPGLPPSLSVERAGCVRRSFPPSSLSVERIRCVRARILARRIARAEGVWGEYRVADAAGDLRSAFRV